MNKKSLKTVLRQEKTRRWLSFLFGVIAAISLFLFAGWLILTLVAKFGGQDWLVTHHLSREEFFPGYLETLVSWPALLLGFIAVFFSCLFGAQEEDEIMTQAEFNKSLSARLKQVDDTEELNSNIHKLMEEN